MLFPRRVMGFTSLVFTQTEPLRLVISSSNGIVRLFDPRSGVMVMSKKLTSARVQQLASSPGGWQLALRIDFSIYLWDLQSETTSFELKEHTSYVYCIAYSPCGQWMASSSDDRTARLWHRQSTAEKTWLCVSVVRGFFGTVQNISWNPVVPMEFLTGSLDGSVRVWRVISNNDVGDESSIAVKMVWGSNLRILCAEGLAFRDAVALDPIHSKLLGQCGVVEGAVVPGGEDGWGEGEAMTAAGDGWNFSGGIVTAADVWGDCGVVVTGGDTLGDDREASGAGNAWGEETAVVAKGEG